MAEASLSRAVPLRERALIERIFAVSVFPLGMAAAVAGTLALLDAGADPANAALAPTLAAGALILGLERVFPLHESWLHSRGDLRVDAAHAVSVGATFALVQPAVAYAGIAAAAWLTGEGSRGPWPGDWPLLAQLPLALVVAELPKYWHHRLQHQTDILWRFHATHHSAPRLYWLNAARFHPIDIAIDTTVGLFVLFALGCPLPVLALFATVSNVHGYFQHANLELRAGPLNYVFSMAELHRWHHSKTMEEANHNYGQNVIVWDLVFGTFFWPSDREPPEDIGIPDLPAFPMTYWRQLASPFRWRQIREASGTFGPPAARGDRRVPLELEDS